MLQANRPEFEAQMRKFCAGANVPATDERIEAYWTGLAKMSLATFVRVTDHLLGLEDWQFPKKPGLLWAVEREMLFAQRAPIDQRVDHGPKWSGDRWDIAANNHLLAHITRQGERGVHYASRWFRSTYPVPARPDQETVELVHAITTAKAAWAEGMREWDADGKLPTDGGKEFWAECIGNGDLQANHIRALYARQEAA